MDRTLVLMRHAKSSWSSGEPDFDRPLAARGRRDAAAAAAWMLAADIAYDLVWCSGAVRARETWAQLSDGGVTAGRVEYVDAIYHAHAETLAALLRGLPDDAQRVLVIGHQPTLESFAVAATHAADEREDPFPEGFRTSGIAILRQPGTWSLIGPGSAQLVDVHFPTRSTSAADPAQ